MGDVSHKRFWALTQLRTFSLIQNRTRCRIFVVKTPQRTAIQRVKKLRCHFCLQK